MRFPLSEEEDEDEDDEDDLLRKTGNFVGTSESLPKGIIRVKSHREILLISSFF